MIHKFNTRNQILAQAFQAYDQYRYDARSIRALGGAVPEKLVLRERKALRFIARIEKRIADQQQPTLS